MGSEFHARAANSGVNKYINLVEAEKRYVLSGRTAIAHIIEDILSYSILKKVALPDYCCASMIKPFYCKGIDVVFYGSHSFEKIIDHVEAVLVMDYFGVENSLTIKIAELSKKKRKILIVDATQTAFSRFKTYNLADYALASYRKWTDCLCAAVYSRKGFFIESPIQDSKTYITLWRKAADMKKIYLKHNQGNKDEFLRLYKEANKLLDIEYNGYAAPPSEIERFESIDSDDIRKCRRENALFLIEVFLKTTHSKQSDVRLLYKQLNDEDCPLFVPTLVNTAKRDEIRKKLVERRIYCPVHWPIDQRYPYSKTRYHECEISLICDQRYTKKDMAWEAEELLKSVSNSN